MTVIRMTKLKAKLIATVDERGKRIPAHIIGQECGISPSTLSHLSAGRRAFTRKQLAGLCKYYHCEPRDLAGWLEFVYDEQSPSDVAAEG